VRCVPSGGERATALCCMCARDWLAQLDNTALQREFCKSTGMKGAARSAVQDRASRLRYNGPVRARVGDGVGRVGMACEYGYMIESVLGGSVESSEDI
jgi:hypothetical protein